MQKKKRKSDGKERNEKKKRVLTRNIIPPSWRSIIFFVLALFFRIVQTKDMHMSSNPTAQNCRRTAANFVAAATSAGRLFLVRAFVLEPFLDLGDG
jgi:hypothetical protein